MLTTTQKLYVTNSGYTTVAVYNRTMQIMDPKVEGQLLKADAKNGLQVTLYSKGWKTRVVEGVICGYSNKQVHIKVDPKDRDKLYAPGTLVELMQAGSDGPPLTNRESLESIFNRFSELENDSSSVVVLWPLYYARRTIQLSAEDTPVQIRTEKKRVLIEYNSEDELHQQRYDADNELSNDDSDTDSSDGENDKTVRLPRNRRRRLYQYLKEIVKNDIAHVFFRYERVLSKDHGAYFDFMTAMRDAIFVLNQNDLDECLHVLREKKKMSDKEIVQKMTYDFDWFLRRVRRTVPEPPLIEKRYLEAYDKYNGIICSKSGKALFATKDAKKAHRSALKHMRRNCISDIPFCVRMA